jgi:hypothetical protein
MAEYDPAPTPQNSSPEALADLIRHIENELNKIKEAVNGADYIKLRIYNVAPERPQVGLYAADGTNWNPGSGAGVYFYNGSTYTQL